MTDRTILQHGFLSHAGWAGAASVPVAGDASNRRYERLTQPDGQTAILMDAAPGRGENVAPFVRMSKHLTQAGFSAPLIYQQDSAQGFLLIEDLGDDLFARLMVRDQTQIAPLYRAATDVLIALHGTPKLSLPIADPDWLGSMITPAFEWYAQDAGRSASDAFQSLFRQTGQSLETVPKVVTLRDYHAENLLWLPQRSGVAKVGLLDFQDAVLGHPAYDLVSVLQDARRDVSPEIEREMIARYVEKTKSDQRAFRAAYALLGAQRNLRILGIFARLCLRDGKAHYVDMIPRVWDYVMRNLAHPALHEMATLVDRALPRPTPQYLEHMKSRCPTPPAP